MNGLIRCAGCGKLIARGSEEMVFADGRFYCADCVDNGEVFKCPNCGEWHRSDMGASVYANGEFQLWCDDCVNSDAAFYCDECHTWHSSHDYSYVAVDGDTICDECFTSLVDNEEIRTCEECGEYHRSFRLTHLTDFDEYVCGTCLRGNFTRCDVCGSWERNGGTTRTRDNRNVCADCLRDEFRYCAECDEYVPNSEWDEELGMCDNCSLHVRDVFDIGHDDENTGLPEVSDTIARSDNARIRGYHCAPPLQFFGDMRPSWNGRPHHWGIELETDVKSGNPPARIQRALNMLDEIAGEHMFFERDCSIPNGFEIITHPHTEEAFYELPWRQIFDACMDNGLQSHDAGTCGLHMHFSREIFGADEEVQDDNIAKLLQFFELYFDEIVKVSRRTEEQLRWCGKFGIKGKTQAKAYAKDKRGHHGVAVNMANSATVEIRIMRGTLNYDSFMASVDFLATVVKNSCRIGWSDTTDDFEWLVGIKDSTKEYLRRRGAFTDAVRVLDRM